MTDIWLPKHECSKSPKTITIVGGGRMGSVIAEAIREYLPLVEALRVTARSTETIGGLRRRGFDASSDNRAACEGADIVVLAVRPLDALGVAGDLGLTGEQKLISVAAGVPISALRGIGPAEVSRAMPTAAALTGEGITPMVADENSSAVELFRSIGDVILTTEDRIMAWTHITSCAVAFWAKLGKLFAEASDLGEGGLEAVFRTMEAAAWLAAERGSEKVMDMVATPGGLTETGLGELDKIRDIFDSLFGALHEKYAGLEKKLRNT